MDQSERDEGQRRLEEIARARFPDGTLEQVRLLAYGDDPEVEPGEAMIRVTVPATDRPGGGDPAGPGDKPTEPGQDTLQVFHHAHGAAIEQFRDDVRRQIPGVTAVEFVETRHEQNRRLRLRLGTARPGAERGGDLTPVMARLGPADLETLDTLITTGIAANRADAVRWTLARIRERPAYAELRERARQIEELKTQF